MKLKNRSSAALLSSYSESVSTDEAHMADESIRLMVQSWVNRAFSLYVNSYLFQPIISLEVGFCMSVIDKHKLGQQ